ncbi:MAG: DUF3310 domain-containing protein [Terrisporobacter sp.]|uniref:DUF3310 domain-containing protein n=1 Tax=Terrisporobacter sp. TaxID=1965305 RepID=UPI002A9206F2|nr:DUF3310 domain-containing protein [Terrisporobacter sp.]MDY6153700.1 DUF3310 domain-containing protein [Terrisporobacter sp.]
MINETQINIEEIGGLSDILDCFENARYFTDNEAIIVAIEDAIVDRGATEGLILIPATMIVDGKKYDKKQIDEVIEYLLVEMERNINEATKKTEIYKEIVDTFKNYINDNSNYDSDHKEEEVKTNELYFGICEENGFAEDELTMGKVYEIRAEDEHCCFVLNDLGKVWCYSPTRFSKIYGEINKENIDEQGDYYLISPDEGSYIRAENKEKGYTEMDSNLYVICTNNSEVEKELTIGKQYKTKDEQGDYYLILSDEGIKNYYIKDRFKKMDNDKFTITQNTNEEKPDMVNHPKHYTSGTLGIEVINTMEMCSTEEEFMGYLRCNALKYISRFENKNGLEDVKKCAWYVKKYLTVQGLDEKDCRSEETYNVLKIVENSVTKESLVQVLKGMIIRDITQRTISGSIVFIEKLIEELEK